MASNYRKHRGYKAQRIVANYLAAHGFPYAESTGAGRSGTDITGTIGIDWEIKARRGFKVTEALNQAKERLDPKDIPIIVMQPDGWGEARIGDWPAIMPLSVMTVLLQEAGYGEKPEAFLDSQPNKQEVTA